MPSWNIHIAQTEHLLARDGASARVIRDGNAFLFGNLMPDIPVGYMVPGVPHIPYRETHFTDPVPIPKPHERAYWDRYVAPVLERAREAGEVLDVAASPRPLVSPGARPAILGADTTSVPYPEAPLEVPVVSSLRSLVDLTLGVWAHLLADAIWNHRVNEYLDAIGGRPGEGFRIKKQADFDGFGKTLAVSSIPRETDALVEAAASFGQYGLARESVHDAIVVAHEIVRTSGVAEHLPYRLLTEEFFDRVFTEVVEQTDAILAERIGRL